MPIRGKQQTRDLWQSQSQPRSEHPANRKTRAGRILFNLMKSRRVRIGLASILLLSVAVTVAVNVIPARAKHAVELATLYGASNATVKTAVNAAAWPQKKNNWCGVATVAAIAQFRGLAVTQTAVANYLNSTAGVSAWGTAPTSG